MKNEVYDSNETRILTDQNVDLGYGITPGCRVEISTFRIKRLSGTTGYDPVVRFEYLVVTPSGEHWAKEVHKTGKSNTTFYKLY